MKQLLKFAVILFIFATAGCKSSVTSPSGATYSGLAQTIGTGSANTWIRTDASGNLSSVGISISDAALATVGSMDTMFELPIPTGFSSMFKSIALDYATHDPAPYNMPHFDPHFFLIDMNARMNIMDGEDARMPTNMMMPSGYFTDSMSQMMMGVHWMDSTAPEFHGQPFKTAFDYGFSMGSLVFTEVMCDKAALMSHMNLTNTIRKPTMMSGMSMSLPSSYKVSYDASAKVTTIELDGFN